MPKSMGFSYLKSRMEARVIKLRMTNTKGEPFILLGLSENNIQALRADKPIHFQLKDVGFPGGELAILWGETEEAILEALRKEGFPL